MKSRKLFTLSGTIEPGYSGVSFTDARIKEGSHVVLEEHFGEQDQGQESGLSVFNVSDGRIEIDYSTSVTNPATIVVDIVESF